MGRIDWRSVISVIVLCVGGVGVCGYTAAPWLASKQRAALGSIDQARPEVDDQVLGDDAIIDGLAKRDDYDPLGELEDLEFDYYLNSGVDPEAAVLPLPTVDDTVDYGLITAYQEDYAQNLAWCYVMTQGDNLLCQTVWNPAPTVPEL